MRHGSLFSGIGGFDLAAEWMGWENVFHCEWNEFGKRVLSYYWPEAISYHDITQTDFTIHRGQIDILTGGFPCQPYSSAGKRRGKEDDRHLWPEMLRAIRETAPSWVVGENVRGLVNWNGGMVFDEVQADLEVEGYEVLPFLLPACGVGAPHRRDRVWFIAHSSSNRRERERSANETKEGLQPRSGTTRKLERRFEGLGFRGAIAYSNECDDRRAAREDARADGPEGLPKWDEVREPVEPSEVQRDASDPDNERLQRSKKRRIFESCRKERDEHPSKRIRTAWENFPTQPPICGGDDGLPTELDGITFSRWRNESIKAYGNAIVPQVALQIFRAIGQYENLD